MLTVFEYGFSVLFEYFYVVLIFFLTVLGAGFLITNISLDKTVDSGRHFFAALSIGGVALALLTYALMFLGYLFPAIIKPGSFLLLFFLIWIALKNLWHLRWVRNQHAFIFGGIFFFILLLLRLAFLKNLLLPGYSDSPIHFQIIEGLLDPTIEPVFLYSIANIFSNYYHFGFHSLAAWLVAVSGVPVTDSISLLGQFFLILAPVSVSFLVYVLSDESKGAFFAALLAALGWHMPAFAVNWGKFPALVALSAFPAVLGYFFLCSKRRLSRKNLPGLLLLFLGLVLLHTRITFLLSLIVFIYLTVSKMDLDESQGYFKSALYAVLFLIILFPLLKPLQYFYVQMPVLIVFSILLPLAFRAYLRSTVAVFLFVVGLWVVGALPNFLKMPALLNKEFLEMVLYIPLSVVGGMGFAGISKSLSEHFVSQKIIPLFFIILIITSFLQQASIYPDPCCDYFQKSDALAFEFMQENLPEKSLVLISAFYDGKTNLGTDAGIWIAPLLNFPTNKFSYDANWNVQDRFEQICEFGAERVFIYAGGRVYSFNDKKMSQAEWYELVFRSGKTTIYKLKPCS